MELAEGKKKPGFWVPLLINSTGAHFFLPRHWLWARSLTAFWLLTQHPLTGFRLHISPVPCAGLRATGKWALGTYRSVSEVPTR